MFNRRKKIGQNITEYMILVAGVLVVVILATSKGGFFTKGVDKSINMMFDSVEDMATVQCLGTIDDVNGQWSGWGAWVGCGWDPDSSSCLEYSTHICNNPSPQCGGTECTLEITVGSTTPLNRTERKSQACYAGSWTPGTCPAFSCTGTCGSTVGTCTTGDPTCDTGCCDPADKPATTVTCTKPAYPDVWTELNNWICEDGSTGCGKGIARQTVTCSGMCCDADLKYPTRAACTNGCCVASLYVYTDVGAPMSGPEDDTPIYADFGPKDNGQPDSVPCPIGYTGGPTRTCTAIADLICLDSGGCPGTPSSGLSCKGNDIYSAPSSCYNIDWGALSGECQPGNCLPITADVGYGSYTLDYTFPDTLHDATASVDCATLSQSDGVTKHTAYLGQLASYYCWLEEWQNLNAPCIPNCPSEDYLAGVVTVNFPETVDDTQATVTCSDYDEQPPGLGTIKYVGSLTRDCGISPLADGQWGGVSGTCDFKPCDGTAYMDGNSVVEGWFGNGTKASPGAPVAHGTPITLTCSDIDSRYDGSFSRTCTYGDWLDPTGGCAAKSCDPWTTDIPDINGVSVTFAGTGHNTPQTGAWTDNTYDCDAAAKCCFGQWFDAGMDCGTVTSAQINGVNDYSGTCAAYQCTGTEPSGDMSMCPGDGTDLTATDVVDWSVVEYDNCTARKCEYQCSQYYYKSGNNCYLAVCDGPAPGSASGCSGDESNLTASQNGTLRHLVSDCAEGAACDASRCTAGDKCEYYCPAGAVVYNGGCCTPKTCAGAGYCAENSGTGTLQYPSDECGGQLTCRECCGNGAIGSGEVCDKNGPVFNPSQDTCSEVNSSYDGGTLGCGSDCTSFDTSRCCTAADGTWGATWTDVGSCTACYQQQQGTCNGASCGGSCPADAANGITASGIRNVACGAVPGGWSGWVTGSCSVSCGGGTATDTRTCNDPSPSCGGLECLLSDNVTRGLTETTAPYSCNTQLCPPPSCCGSGCPADDFGNPSPTWGSAQINYSSDFIWSGSLRNGVNTGDTVAYYVGWNGGDRFHCGFDKTTRRWVVMSKCGGYDAYDSDQGCYVGDRDSYCRAVIRADCGRYACGSRVSSTCQNTNGGWGCFPPVCQ